MQYEFPADKKISVIVNTDAKNEADDQLAIVHAKLTPHRPIRVYEDIDARFIHEDFFAKLKRFARERDEYEA